MANDNNNSNELVAEDTAELEAITMRREREGADAPLESDDNTFDFADHAHAEPKNVRKLRYDVEQLRAKWAGLESELRAREEIADDLNTELAGVREALSRKEKLVKTRDGKIKALKAEIRDREEQHRSVLQELQAELDTARKTKQEIPAPPVARKEDRDDNVPQIRRLEDYADLLRRKMQDMLAGQDHFEKENSRLHQALTRAEDRGRMLERNLSEQTETTEALEDQLANIENDHAEEIRMLRFELGEAQETVAQTETLNSQLASDLVDTQGFKAELERMLCDNDEEASSRIRELEREVTKLTRLNSELEEKLDGRSDAINVLLGELARKNEQVESIGDLGEAISDLDDRISEQFEDSDDIPVVTQRANDRVTRVLLGKIGEKLLRFPLFKDKLTIGRTADNDIQLDAPYISRKHAVVTTDGDVTRVIDWGSKNGVHVNSERITEHFLKNGDILTIGNAHFRYDERPKRDS